ncbi:MAG: DNA polymerase [bacterium]
MSEKPKKRLLVVDGNGLLYRAYHAFPKELSTPSGEIVGAVYGFTRILLSTIKTLKPYSVAVAFDLKGGTFRNELAPSYKATRQKMPEDLAGQIERTHEIVEKLEFPIYTAVNYEADDVIGTIALQASTEHPDIEVVILTGDQDILQLVTEHVHVYSPVNAAKVPIMFTPEKVREKYGFDPLQMIEYKALRGDPSDNIPGVPGIGEVTAKQLLAEFHDIENLYKAVEKGEIDGIKAGVLAKLKEHKDSAFLSHKLATIVTDAPVTFDPDKCKMELADASELIALFKKLNFKSLMNDLPVSHRLLSHASDVFSGEAEVEEAKPEEEEYESESQEIDKRLMPVLREMEKLGAKTDVGYLKELEVEFTKDIEGFKGKLHDLAGEEFNPDSPQQIAHTFYETLGIPTKNIRKGKSGYTTDAATMAELSKEYPIAQVLLNYRELTKLQGTYVKPLQGMVDENSRIHTSYDTETATGRISSKDPNLQNIPVRSEQGKRLRKAFIADKDKVLIAADYSQLELRIAAHLSGDPVMIQAFKSGRDFHTETAERMGVDRRVAKIINFSILFGKGAYGLAWEIGTNVAEAKQYLAQYFETYSVLRTYLDKVQADAREKGYAETLYGRRRYFPEIMSSNFHQRAAAEREAMNMPIQGTEADILKLAMIELADRLKKEKLKTQLLLTVHDELVLEGPVEEQEKVVPIMREAMTTVVKLDVPLEVTAKAGTNWAEMEEIKD